MLFNLWYLKYKAVFLEQMIIKDNQLEKVVKEQAGFIQDYWDEEGERKWATT